MTTRLGKTFLLVTLGTLFGSVGQVLYKVGADRLPQIWFNWPIPAGFFLYVICALVVNSLKQRINKRRHRTTFGKYDQSTEKQHNNNNGHQPVTLSML